MQDRVYKGDTALVEASLFDEDGIHPLAAQTVEYTIRKPDGTELVVPAAPISETLTNIAYNDTTLPGQYLAQITFVLNDADHTRKSTILSFEVVDPLESSFGAVGDTTVDVAVDRAWMKLEDLFDSEIGGPHLRDRTMAIFDRTKMARLLPDAFYNINNYFQPATGYDEATFPFTSQTPLLSQALLVESVRHLMRSYVEQPSPIGMPAYFDRRDYLNRWQSVLTLEENRLNMWLDLFKRGQQGFGHTSILVGGYASYSSRYPRYMRGRMPYVYRY